MSDNSDDSDSEASVLENVAVRASVTATATGTAVALLPSQISIGTVGGSGVGYGVVGVPPVPPAARFIPPPISRPRQGSARLALARQAWVMKAGQLRELVGSGGNVPKAVLVERCVRGLGDGTISPARFWEVAREAEEAQEVFRPPEGSARQAMARQAWVMKAGQLRILFGYSQNGNVPKAKLVERCVRGLEDGSISSARFWKVASMRDVPKEAKVAQVANVGAKEWKEVQQAKETSVVGWDHNDNNNNNNNTLSAAAAAARHARARAHAYAVQPTNVRYTKMRVVPTAIVRGLLAPQLRDILGPVPGYGASAKKDALVERCIWGLEAGTISTERFWAVANPAVPGLKSADNTGRKPYGGDDPRVRLLLAAKDDEIRGVKLLLATKDDEIRKLRDGVQGMEGEISRLRQELDTLGKMNRSKENTSKIAMSPVVPARQEQVDSPGVQTVAEAHEAPLPAIKSEEMSVVGGALDGHAGEPTLDEEQLKNESSPVAPRSLRKRHSSSSGLPMPNDHQPKEKAMPKAPEGKKGALSAEITKKKRARTPSKSPVVGLRSRRKRTMRSR